MEKEGLKKNIAKTQVMCSEYVKGRVKKTSNCPCGLCVVEENSNSIACIKCSRHWVHKDAVV